MNAYVCVTCGVQHAPSDEPPERCAVCEDERQYVRRGGQEWTTIEDLGRAGHRNRREELEPGLVEIRTEPRFAIGQRALLVRTPEGGVLWDCVSYLDEETTEAVAELGGIAAVTCSHPHFYASMVEWAGVFGAEVLVPEADREWVMRPDTAIRLWSGSHEIVPGVTLVQTGGHFEGSAVLHWTGAAEGRGAILTGDTISVVADPQWVTFMRSYPNFIPLPADSVGRIEDALRPLRFDRLYGGWSGDDVLDGARDVVERSIARYVRWVGAT